MRIRKEYRMKDFISDELYEKEENVADGEQNQSDIVDMGERKKIRDQFAHWRIGNKTYDLKLRVSDQLELEKKFRKNLISLMGDEDNIPPITTMLQVIHSAIEPWQHGLKLRDIHEMYEKYLQAGGNMLELYTRVYLPIFTVSGFFSNSMAEDMEYALEETAQKTL